MLVSRRALLRRSRSWRPLWVAQALWYIYLVCRVLDPMRSVATCVPSDLESSKVIGGLYLGVLDLIRL
jgi:hypothetical protein